MRFGTFDLVSRVVVNDSPHVPPESDLDAPLSMAVWLISFIHVMGVLLIGVGTAIISCSGDRAPWVPSLFYTDGILMWFLPVAIVLPVLLWPASLVAWGAIVVYRKASEAETFCGISRARLRRDYRELRGRWRGGYQGLDPEGPREGGGISPAVLPPTAVASSSGDDDGGLGCPPEQQSQALTGGKNVHGERASIPPTPGSAAESVESQPPAYQP